MSLRILTATKKILLKIRKDNESCINKNLDWVQQQKSSVENSKKVQSVKIN